MYFSVCFWGWLSDRYEGTLNLCHARNANFGPRWTLKLKQGLLRRILMHFLHFRALFGPILIRIALSTQFAAQNLSRNGHFLHAKCISGRLWAKYSPRMI